MLAGWIDEGGYLLWAAADLVTNSLFSLSLSFCVPFGLSSPFSFSLSQNHPQDNRVIYPCLSAHRLTSSLFVQPAFYFHNKFMSQVNFCLKLIYLMKTGVVR